MLKRHIHKVWSLGTMLAPLGTSLGLGRAMSAQPGSPAFYLACFGLSLVGVFALIIAHHFIVGDLVARLRREVHRDLLFPDRHDQN